MSAVLQNVEPVSDSPAPSDAALIERFVSARDADAFGELVRRHSGVVLGVCRRILSDSNDIDDVFQATFLVLVRNATKVRKRTSLASWLYGVAYRMSMRVARSKQRRRETALVEQSSTEVSLFESLANQHDQQVLDDELNGLPEKYRQPLVLKFLAGKSTDDIACELGMTVGAVEGLLKRGRVELRRKLLQRGISLGAALIAIECSQQAFGAVVSKTLIDTTIQAGLAWSLKPNIPTVDVVSPRAVELVGKEIITMTATTKATLVAGLTLGGLIAGMGSLGLVRGTANGNLEAAGAISTIAMMQNIGNEIELTAFAADQEPKPNRKTEPASGFGIQAAQPTEHADAEGKTPSLRNVTARVQRIEKELQSECEVNFPGTALQEAVEFLSSTHGVEILFDEKSLHDEGISKDLQIDLKIGGGNLKTVLRTMLDRLELDYIVKYENLFITTATAAEQHLETRLYDLRRCGSGEKHRNSVIESMVNTIQGPHTKWNTSNLKKIEELSDITVGDGGGGVIQPLENALLIRQTQRVHEEIEELIDLLERYNSRQPPHPNLGNDAF